jgi:hypothetical protein
MSAPFVKSLKWNPLYANFVFKLRVALTGSPCTPGHVAGERLGIKEVDDGIWLDSFSHYDLGTSTWSRNTATPRHPFGPKLSPMS